MQLSDFDYFLPKELIAQYPAKRRTDSRLLILHREDGSIEHRRFSDIIDYINKDDLLILNNTKVFPARLFGKKITGGRIEALLLKALGDGRWECQVGGKLKKAEDIVFDDGLKARAEEDLCSGRKIIRFDEIKGLGERLERLGKAPLPPYIKRAAAISDKRRYQTVYAKIKGAVAAPTAGLHFSDGLLSKIKKKGARIKEVTLHVGPGTFQPVKCDNISEHKMEPEYFRITEDVAKAVNKVKAKKGKIIAVGTTSTKAIESAVDDSGMLNAMEGYSELFIHPPYRFKIADALLTNFHLPKSTLLMLVSAFTGRELILKAYCEAVKQGYRFYSYGDAMLII